MFNYENEQPFWVKADYRYTEGTPVPLFFCSFLF